MLPLFIACNLSFDGVRKSGSMTIVSEYALRNTQTDHSILEKFFDWYSIG